MKRMIGLLMVLLLLPLPALAEGMLSLQITRSGETMTLEIPNTVIPQREPTAEEIVCNPGDAAIQMNAAQGGASGEVYRCENTYAPHETLGFRVHEVSRFSRYEGDTPLWTAEIRDYGVHGWQEVREGVLLWGYTDVSLDDYGWPITAWMTLLSPEGEVCWSQPLDPRIGWEQTNFVLEDGDGVYTVFGTYYGEGQEILCVRKIGADGTMAGLVETPATALGIPGEKPRFHIYGVQAADEGYLLHLTSGTLHMLAQTDGEGNVQQVVTFQGEENCLTPTHILLHGGSLWLSGYLTPGEADADYFSSCRSEIEDVLISAYHRMQGWRVNVDLLGVDFGIGGLPVTSGYLVPRIREKYTAVLLQIDPDTFLPRQAYTVDGCLGGALRAEGGGAAWNTESLSYCYYSPMTSSFTVSGAARIFRYTFAADGTLLDTVETDEFAGYLR